MTEGDAHRRFDGLIHLLIGATDAPCPGAPPASSTSHGSECNPLSCSCGLVERLVWWRDVPRYTTELRAAMDVWKACIERGFRVEIESKGTVTVHVLDESGRPVWSSAQHDHDDLPYAICEAAHFALRA